MATKFSVKHQGKDIPHPPSTIHFFFFFFPWLTLCLSLSLSFTICNIQRRIYYQESLLWVFRLTVGGDANTSVTLHISLRTGVITVSMSELNNSGDYVGADLYGRIQPTALSSHCRLSHKVAQVGTSKWLIIRRPIYCVKNTTSNIMFTINRAGWPPKTSFATLDNQLPSVSGAHGLKDFLCSDHLLESFEWRIYTYR